MTWERIRDSGEEECYYPLWMNNKDLWYFPNSRDLEHFSGDKRLQASRLEVYEVSSHDLLAGTIEDHIM